MAELLHEGFVQFNKRMDAMILVVGEDEALDNMESQKIEDIEKARDERKRKLLYDNLDLIMRHRQEIQDMPRYANIDVHYALRGGAAYVGPIAFRKKLAIAGTPFTINLTLKSLLWIWTTAAFKVTCRCGETAYIRSFGGSPLSGVAVASAYCSHCKNEIREIKDRKFRSLAAPAQNILGSEEAVISQRFSAGAFGKASELCSLEKMIQELKLKEYKEANHDS